MMLVVIASIVATLGDLATAQTGAPPAQVETGVQLETGQVIERELAGGQQHRYRIALSTGQYAAVTVDQRGIDVVVQVFESGDHLLVRVDDEVGPDGTEQVGVAADKATTYTISVQPMIQTAPAGAYQIRVNELRAATDREGPWIRASQPGMDAQ